MRGQAQRDTMTKQEAAYALRKSTKTLERWRKRGYGPQCAMIGGQVCYRSAEVLAFKDDLFAGKVAELED